eukprot:SAG31_NODE_132_length_23398_cov_14.557620_6_plen_270_part_00
MHVLTKNASFADALKSALKLVHDRHEALRMYYTIDQETGDRCMAVVSKEIFVLPLKEVNLISLGEEAAEKEAQRLYSHDACHEQFDPFNQYPQSGFGPLSHFYLIQVTEDKALFFYGMHHAILDGFSDTVMWTEINTAYANIVRGASPSLPALDAQYPDFALWQAEKLYQVITSFLIRISELPLEFLQFPALCRQAQQHRVFPKWPGYTWLMELAVLLRRILPEFPANQWCDMRHGTAVGRGQKPLFRFRSVKILRRPLCQMDVLYSRQ